MPSNWRDLGIVICDPSADMKLPDAELWLSLIMLAINHNEIELALDNLIKSASQFGNRT